MQIAKKRPINLNLLNFSFPITAITSIIHRITGVVLFFAVPLYLWMLDVSLADKSGFVKVQRCLDTGGMKFFNWLVLCTLSYHFLAGLRHIIMDFGFGESRCVAKITSKLLLVLSVVVFVLWGLWIC